MHSIRLQYAYFTYQVSLCEVPGRCLFKKENQVQVTRALYPASGAFCWRTEAYSAIRLDSLARYDIMLS